MCTPPYQVDGCSRTNPDGRTNCTRARQVPGHRHDEYAADFEGARCSAGLKFDYPEPTPTCNRCATPSFMAISCGSCSSTTHPQSPCHHPAAHLAQVSSAFSNMRIRKKCWPFHLIDLLAVNQNKSPLHHWHQVELLAHSRLMREERLHAVNLLGLHIDEKNIWAAWAESRFRADRLADLFAWR